MRLLPFTQREGEPGFIRHESSDASEQDEAQRASREERPHCPRGCNLSAAPPRRPVLGRAAWTACRSSWGMDRGGGELVWLRTA